MEQIKQIITEIERRRVKYKELISKSFGVEQEYFKGMVVVADEMLLFINSLPAEQPSERLGDEIDHFRCSDEFALAKRAGEEVAATAWHFAQWQKEQDKALIERAEDHAKLAGIALGEKEAKEKFINKACKWLHRCIDVDNEVKVIDGEPDANSFIQKNIYRIKVANQIVEDFKKAMDSEK